jgi:Carboxypeptidase regulatory-like domain
MNRKRFVGLVFALLAVVLLSYQPAHAQANVQAGSIQGVVTDPQGSVVAGAKVTITNKDTGASSETASTSSGTFTSGSLTPGTYVVRVEAPGFKTTEYTVPVVVNVITTANAKMELGATTTVVEVSSQAVSVNTDQAQVSGTLTTQQIENLPINGRNFLDLAQLEPGVQIQDGSNFDPTKTGFSSISFGGRFGRSARIAVDGVDVSDENVGTTTTSIPSSAIAEFQLAQSSLDLSNDLTSSGAVNVATKSGTNTLHGELFGLFRDSSQAAAFPSNAQFQRSQYGGDIGGPIIKDKLFFFVDAERTLQHATAGVVVGAPFASFSGTFPAPFHETNALGKLDWQATKNVHVFERFSFFQNLAQDSNGGVASFSFFNNRDRTKSAVTGVDFNTGSFTHSFRFEYLKFVNVLGDAVTGSGEPFADFPTSLYFPNENFFTGPSFLAPQSTIQSDHQLKYDGSKVWGSHIIRYGVGYNYIHAWTSSNFFGLNPQIRNFGGFDAASNLVCPGGQTGGNCPLNYLPDQAILGNGQGSFTELQAFGKSSGGLGPDNRLSLYVGDSWKIKPNLTATYGLRYVRDTNRTDSDLPPIPAINALLPGFGNSIQQPNHNFAPQLGVAWDPKSDGKTVIRAGIGVYYDNIVFNNMLFDRLLRLPNGAFNATPFACIGGAATPVSFAGALGTQFIPGGNATCLTPIGGILPATAVSPVVSCAGNTVAQCLAAFQGKYQAAAAAAGTNAPNPNYVPTILANNGAVPPNNLLAPDYQSPRAIQMNVGFQREIRPGMVLSADYLRNVGLHYLLGIDENHTGDAAFLNVPAAQQAIAATLLACGAPSIHAAAQPGGCTPLHPIGPGSNGAATIVDFASRGLDSPGDLGVSNCNLPVTGIGAPCAFAGINSNVGPLSFEEPIGRSVYNAMDIKLTQNLNNPIKGVKYANFQFSYTLSRFQNSGSASGPGTVASADQDFVNASLDNRNPLRFTGDASLDRTNQFNLGGYVDLPKGFRLGTVAHFWSPLAALPSLSVTAGPAQIFQTDFTGDGTVADPLPLSVNPNGSFNLANVGAFSRSLGAAGLTAAINNYNTNIAGKVLTPGGQALLSAPLGFTQADLIALGATPPALAPTAPNNVAYGWLKTMDVQFSWVGRFWHERLTIQPSVGFYNVFNFANFDSPGNALSGLLGLAANGPASASSISGASSTDPNRSDRIGVGSGLFQFGQPRVIEWGLKFSF